MTTTLIKKHSKRDTLWGIRNKSSHHILSVFEHRSIARETKKSLENPDTFEVVKLSANKEKENSFVSNKISLVPDKKPAKTKPKQLELPHVLHYDFLSGKANFNS